MRTKVSSNEVREGDPADFWRSVVASSFYPVDVKDYDRQTFRAEFEANKVGDIQISRFSGTGHTVIRPSNLIRPSDADFYAVSVMLNGTRGFDHNGRNTTNGPGDILLVDVTRPFEIAHGSALDLISADVPRGLLDEALGVTKAAAGLALDGRSAEAAVVRDFLLSLERRADSLDPQAARRMAAAGVDLIAAGFAQRMARVAPASASSAATLVRAQAYIEGNVTDPRLDVDRIAAAVGVSARRLHEVFAAEHLSVIGYLWERRLLRARKLLANRLRQQLNIGAIAHLVGFASQAHFTRRFKRRFGMTPSDYVASSHDPRRLQGPAVERD